MNCEALAPLLRYPDTHFFENLERAGVEIDALGSLDLFALQSLYTSTFDLAPVCSPYLGVHLFENDEGRERAALMLGLLRHGAGRDGRELPDHIAEVIAMAGNFSEEEWRDLVRLVLLPALEKMERLLSDRANPFRHVLAAVRSSILEGGPP